MDMFAMALDKAGKDDPIKVAPLSHPLDCFSRCDRGMLPELMNALHVPAPNPWRVTKLPAARSW